MTKLPPDLHVLGNPELFTLTKVAFLCSRRFPEPAARRAREWAEIQRAGGVCVMSGFHSPIERDVFNCLVKGTQPIIVVLAKGLRRQPEPEFQEPLAVGRLLVITRYAESVTHPCESKCFQRNRMMMEMADRVVVGHAAAGGTLEGLCREYESWKEVTYL